MEVTVVDKVETGAAEESVRALVTSILELEGEDADLSIAFVSDEEITLLNEAYRGQAEATDVLSFRYLAEEGDVAPPEESWFEPDEAEEARYLGDVAISPAVAARNAADDGTPLALELTKLIVHGVLHLLGYDHETDEGEMRAREVQVLARVGHLPALLRGA